MKQIFYSCLKMLESFRYDCIRICRTNDHGAAELLCEQYGAIRENLIGESLSKYQIPEVSKYGNVGNKQDTLLLHELISASGIAIAYLKSKDQNLNKELEAKENELMIKEKQLESTEKLLKKSMDVVKQLQEVQRSKAVADTKKYHREIEKHTKKKPDIIMKKNKS